MMRMARQLSSSRLLQGQRHALPVIIFLSIFLWLFQVIQPTGLQATDYKSLRQSIGDYRPSLQEWHPAAGQSMTMSGPISTSGSGVALTIDTASSSLLPTADSLGNPWALTAAEEAILRPIAQNSEATAARLATGYHLSLLAGLALLRNPAIQAAKAQHQAALTEFSQVAYLDALLARYTAFSEGLRLGVGPMKSVSPRLQFPFPGITALKSQMVSQTSRIAAINMVMAQRDTVTQVHKIYWMLRYLVRAQAITKETITLFKRLEEVADTRYRAGKTTFHDVIKITIQKKILTEKLQTLAGQHRVQESRLLALLDLSAATRLGMARAQTPSLTQPVLAVVLSIADRQRLELVRLQAKIGKLERLVALGEKMILPPYHLELSTAIDRTVLTVGSQATTASFKEKTMAKRGAGLPQEGHFGTRSAWLAQVRQQLVGQRHQLRQLRGQTAYQLQKIWFTLDQALRERALYQHQLLRLTRSALEVATRGYESGRVSFSDVVSAHTDWLKSNLTLAQKNRDVGQAHAALRQIINQPDALSQSKEL